jgi:hypothetical protein
VALEPPAAVGDEPAHPLDVVGIVDHLQLLRGREAADVPAQVWGDRAALQDRAHVAHPLGVLGMEFLHVEQLAWVGLEEPRAGVVR